MSSPEKPRALQAASNAAHARGLVRADETSGPFFVRPSDQRRFRLFLPTPIEVPDALQQQIESRLESMGVSAEAIEAIDLPRLLSTPAPVAYPFLASASLLRPRELPAEIMDPEEFGRPDYDDDADAPALLRVDEAEKLSSVISVVSARPGKPQRSRGEAPLRFGASPSEHSGLIALPTDAEWMTLANVPGRMSWWAEQPWEAASDPTPFESLLGIRDLAFGEYTTEGPGLAPTSVRGGGALTWPWQDPTEWVQTVTALKVPVEQSLGFSGVREIIRLLD